MIGAFFCLAAAMALISISGDIAMRVRLTKREPLGEKLTWWRRGGDEVAATYAELFPGSYIPAFRRFAFWWFIACTAFTVAWILWKSS
jgi:hypothetical protein